MEVVYVPQRGECDCGVAAVAMVTGQSYEQVLEATRDRIESGHGLSELQVQEYLYRHGFAWQKIHAVHQLGGRNQKREVWPPAPWAPVHLIMCYATAECGHFTVMDGTGRVFDPWKRERASLKDADYRSITSVWGTWKVREPLPCA